MVTVPSQKGHLVVFGMPSAIFALLTIKLNLFISAVYCDSKISNLLKETKTSLCLCLADRRSGRISSCWEVMKEILSLISLSLIDTSLNNFSISSGMRLLFFL